MPLWDRWFLDHPRSVGETYTTHLRTAAGFGVGLIAAGAACLVHAAVPRLFVTTASDLVGRLHSRMGERRPSWHPEGPR